MSSVVIIVPGHIETPTGGYVYDRRIAGGLRDLGWSVDVREISDSFPSPTIAAIDEVARVLRSIADEAVVLIDGLAFGAMPVEAEREAARLRLVALVHHPLAAETGIDPGEAARLEVSERRALAAARAVVVTSRATASALTRYGVSEDRIAVVAPGTDRAPLAAGSGGEIRQLLCVASLIPRKGHETLFRALASIRDRPWHLTCVGSLERHPATVQQLRDLLRAERLDDRVTFAGEAHAEAVSGYYNRADLFVLPTEYEGYGMVVAEALAHGVVVISTATGGIPDLVGDTAGVLVAAGDPAALADAISRVLEDTVLRDRLAAGARRVRDRLPGWDVASGTMAEILERVARDGRLQR
jgi:glycosyltransferase involved in cell wall biosynthesis